MKVRVGSLEAADRAEVDALRSSNRWLVDALEPSQLVMAAWDDSFRCVAVSDGSLQTVHGGRARDEVIGQRVKSLYDPSAHDRLDTQLRKLLREGQLRDKAKVIGADSIVREFDVIGCANVAPGIHMTLSSVGQTRHVGDSGQEEAIGAVTVLVAAPDQMTASLVTSLFASAMRVSVVAVCGEPERLQAMVMGHRPQVTTIATSPFAPPRATHDAAVMADAVGRLVDYGERNSIATAVLVLDYLERHDLARSVLAAGARGFFGPTDELMALADVVGRIAAGEEYLSPALASRIAREEQSGAAVLTRREREILRMIALGYTNREVADELFISVRTAENHRARINRAMDFSSRRDLVGWAIEHQMIP